MIGRPIWIALAALFEKIENPFPPKCEYNSTKTQNTKSPKPRPRFGGFWFPTCKKMENKYSRIRNSGYHFFKKRDHGFTNFATFCGGGIGSRNVNGPAIAHTTGHPQGKQTPQEAAPIGTAPPEPPRPNRQIGAVGSWRLAFPCAFRVESTQPEVPQA